VKPEGYRLMVKKYGAGCNQASCAVVEIGLMRLICLIPPLVEAGRGAIVPSCSAFGNSANHVVGR